MVELTGEILRKYRTFRGESQTKFAEYINGETGRRYTKVQISRWENGADDIPVLVNVLLRDKVWVVMHNGDVQLPCFVVAIANQKGGVGKTTTAANVGYGLAAAGYKTLLIDLDPQANLTVHVGHSPISLDPQRKTLYYALGLDRQPASNQDVSALAKPDDDMGPDLQDFVLRASELVPLYVVPSGPSLSTAEIRLITEPAGDRVIRDLIRGVKHLYDFVIIDCPPQFGYLTVNGLTAADEVVIPVQCEMFALMGIKQLLDTINHIRRRANRKLTVAGLLPTMADLRQNEDRAVLDDMQADYGQSFTIFPPVNRATAYAQSAARAMPTWEYDPKALGLDAYRAVVMSVIRRAKERAGQTAEEGHVA